MPKREDERQQRLTGNHPVYCTCIQCTERFLDRRTTQGGRSVWRRWFGKSGGEKVKTHPKDCTCATCNLLRSVDNPAPSGEQKSGLLNKILGKK